MSHWKRQDHPFWGKGGLEESAQEMFHTINGIATFPKYQWRKDHLSIVGPATILDIRDQGYVYELYDGDNTYGFKTLKTAKFYGEKLLKGDA